MNASIDYYGEYMPRVSGSPTSILAVLVLVLVVIIIVLFLFRHFMIRRSISKEYWLPIVDDSGRVIGRVARSVSLENPGVYQHPLIRVLIIKSGTIFLTPRTLDFCPDYGKFDHPFERMMEYGYSVEETIEVMQKDYFPHSAAPKFVLRYKHFNEIGHWQVLLYILTIRDEKELVGVDYTRGKFWTIPQISENLGKSYFSSFLEGEIDFLETLAKSSGS